MEKIRKDYKDTYRAKRRNIYFKDGEIWERVDKVCEETHSTYNRLVEEAVRMYLKNIPV